MCNYFALFFSFLDSIQMYNFTNFAMTLNELEPGMIGVIAPTDCRLRPDIRAMENGDIGMDNLSFGPFCYHLSRKLSFGCCSTYFTAKFRSYS